MRRTGPDKQTRDLIHGRDGICQLDGCTEGPWVIQHRRARGMGGSRLPDTNSPANLVLMADACHRHVEAHPDGAEAMGFRVRQGQDPEAEPIQTWSHGWCYLLADGSVSPVEDNAA